MKKSHLALVSVLMVVALGLFASCGTKPATADESARILSKAAFSTRNDIGLAATSSVRQILSDVAAQPTDSARALSVDFDFDGNLTNTNGGTASYAGTIAFSGSITTGVNITVTIAVTYSDWVVTDNGETYTVDGTLTSTYPLNFSSEAISTTDSSLSFSTSYTLTGDLTIAKEEAVFVAKANLTSQFTFTAAASESSVSATVTCATTGTINEKTVSQSFTFTDTVSTKTLSL